MKHPQRLELRLAELQHAPPAWKFCTVRSQERFDRENAQRADQAKMNGRRLKPRRGRPAARIEAKKTSARGRNRAVTTRKDQEEAEVLRGSLHGVARVLQAAQLHLRLQEAVLLPGCADGVGQQVGRRASQKVTNAPINPNSPISPNMDSSSKTDLETCRIQRIEKKAVRACADAAQGARQGGTEPGTTRFRDGRTTARPPAPRRDPGAPTAQPRPRGPDLESAQI